MKSIPSPNFNADSLSASASRPWRCPIHSSTMVPGLTTRPWKCPANIAAPPTGSASSKITCRLPHCCAKPSAVVVTPGAPDTDANTKMAITVGKAAVVLDTRERVRQPMLLLLPRPASPAPPGTVANLTDPPLPRPTTPGTVNCSPTHPDVDGSAPAPSVVGAATAAHA